ncbi:PBS lyase [Ectothiorhodospira haloalkaliphila]|uniref:non-specific serine/threonine protein kinase n=1 Tax=Ectothiorhodospira haloalkaliphila TaxID=421628 RepID=W8KM79_9GAMM|nr:HEAT repeat domain-containing protein [Ectothiorhodospira haloalkaliphila]AHK80278.1 PBS lyase [Ectothiorhodospira haloalkaliphila]
MSVFSDFRAERQIQRLLEAADLDEAEAQKRLNKLRSLGEAGVRRLLHGLADASGDGLPRTMELLRRLVNDTTLPVFLRALADINQTRVDRVAQVLEGASGFDPSPLARAFRDPTVSKSALVRVLHAHRHRLNASLLLREAYDLQPVDRNALFRVVDEVADESVLPDLVSRASGKDPVIRRMVVKVLRRFDTPQVRAVLQERLNDEDKGVRGAALEALMAMGAVDMEAGSLCTLLHDPDINVQHKAIDAIIQLDDPHIMRHLLPVLQDESEYVRRAAVEVLNGVGNASNIKELLVSIKDEDWWVRARSADALAQIGGPRVVRAVVELIRDEDEFVRRSAVEILNSTRDETALTYLIDALEDSDWWVRERAVDALGSIGNASAVPALLKMLDRDADAAPVVVRNLARLQDDRAVEPLMRHLAGNDRSVRLEAVNALVELADARTAPEVLRAIQQHTADADEELQDMARDASARLEARFAISSLGQGGSGQALPEATSMLDSDTGQIALTLGGADETAAGTRRFSAHGAGLNLEALRPGEMLGERYRFIRRVGKGAFGTVLLMDDVMISETIILKVMNPQLATDDEMIKRFVQELRLSRKITHENVIRIYDFLTVQGVLAISMEYFPSSTLGVVLKQERPMPQDRAVGFAACIASGIGAAHEVGVIHRDLKPGNVLINNREQVKIVDFGIASVTGSADTRLTRTGILIGTPKYMAPEQVTGRKITHSADIYALGVMLYEMITGQVPYSGEDQMAIMYQHVQGQATPPHEVNPGIDRELSAIVMSMMAVNPEDRFPTMQDVRKTLLEFQQERRA